MSASTVRRFAALSVALAAVAGLAGCSSGGSSSAVVTASPGSVPQIGQVVATAPLSEGGHEASKCHGVDDATRDALKKVAYERGWTVESFAADDQGCWTEAEMTAQGQPVELSVDVDQELGVASLRVKDIVVSPSASPSEGA